MSCATCAEARRTVVYQTSWLFLFYFFLNFIYSLLFFCHRGFFFYPRQIEPLTSPLRPFCSAQRRSRARRCPVLENKSTSKTISFHVCAHTQHLSSSINPHLTPPHLTHPPTRLWSATSGENWIEEFDPLWHRASAINFYWNASRRYWNCLWFAVFVFVPGRRRRLHSAAVTASFKSPSFANKSGSFARRRGLNKFKARS